MNSLIAVYMLGSHVDGRVREVPAKRQPEPTPASPTAPDHDDDASTFADGSGVPGRRSP